MIKIENEEVMGWEYAIRGMRNPMNSWAKSDSLFVKQEYCDTEGNYKLSESCGGYAPIIGPNDHELMMKLVAGGPVHAKYRRMITVYCDITAPLYWWKEFDTYKVGTVANSCSTMHKIHEKKFTLEDFSHENLLDGMFVQKDDEWIDQYENPWFGSNDVLQLTIKLLNYHREQYLKTKDKKYWWQMIQLLPSSYNQRRTVMLNYEVLSNIYKFRKNHKLDEWRKFCDWIETLPYSEIIISNELRKDVKLPEVITKKEKK